MKFLKNYTSVGKYITHSANALSACNKAIHELTAGHEFTKILWTVVIPTRVKKSPNGVLRDRFHSTKRFPMMDWKNNIRFLTVLKILQKYTVEDPIALLKCLYPSLSPNEPYEQSLVYHVLNAHINWFTYNRKQLDVCTETFFYDETCEMDDSFDVRCRNCLKLLTLRVKDTVAHKTVNVMFSTDTHTLVSGCCGAPPLRFPWSAETRNSSCPREGRFATLPTTTRTVTNSQSCRCSTVYLIKELKRNKPRKMFVVYIIITNTL